MKKVNLFNKKVMSVGLTASLLFSSVIATPCCYADGGITLDQNKINEEYNNLQNKKAKERTKKIIKTIGIAAAIGVAAYLGYKYNSQITNAISKHVDLNSVKEKTNNALNSTKTFANNAITSLSSKANNALNSTKTFANNTFNSVKAKTNSIFNSTKSFFSKFFTSNNNTVETLSNTTSNVNDVLNNTSTNLTNGTIHSENLFNADITINTNPIYDTSSALVEYNAKTPTSQDLNYITMLPNNIKNAKTTLNFEPKCTDLAVVD